MNIITNTDSYKSSHYLQYPKDTQIINSYIESRGVSKDSPLLFDVEIVHFGLQMFLKEYLSKEITSENIREAEELFSMHGVPFNRAGWETILNKHGGYLPVRIEALAEGTPVPIGTTQVQVQNTDPELPWLTSYLETSLLRSVWYPSTVATISREVKKVIYKYLKTTSDDPDGQIQFKLHDFGARGVSSEESAMIGGCAHIVNFMGTDTISGIIGARKYYHATMPAFSIPAAEHSTITSWGQDNEVAAYRNMLTQFAKPNSLLAVVSDSYNIYHAAEQIWGVDLKQQVLDSGATVVIRPDCYDEGTEILTYKGWKEFKDLSHDDLVAQYDENREITFTKPLKIVNEHYRGKMINFTDKKGRLDITVTPNHRMVIDFKGQLQVKEANDCVFYYDVNIPRAGISGKMSEPLSCLERLMIAFQADGSYNKTKESKNLRFNFTKKRKVDRLVDICKNGGFEYKVTRELTRPQNYQVYVTLDTEISKFFNEWVNIDKVSQEWCIEFLDELSNWDATKRSETRIKYDTTIKSNADVVQQIAILANRGCSYGIHEDLRSDKFSDVYSLTITDKNNIGGQSIIKKEIDYDGRVYCVSVPSGMIVVRKNNKCLISGNSGNPVAVVLSLLRILGERFSFTTNKKGYKVLHPSVRIIQGDGVNYNSINQILREMWSQGWAADNLTFGMGGALLQKLDRDTFKYAMKANARFDGKTWHDVYKEPITDSGKLSKRGILAVVKQDGVYQNIRACNVLYSENQLIKVFENGQITKEWDFDTVRLQAKI